jgi:hypothetical protein
MAAQRNGDLDPGADPRAIARLIHATGRGLDVMARTGRGAAELDAIAESALASLPSRPAGARPRGRTAAAASSRTGSPSSAGSLSTAS